MGNVLPKNVKSDLHGYAEALTKKGRPAKAMQLGECPCVVLLGDRVDLALNPGAARALAKGGDLLVQSVNASLSVAVVYYARTGRLIGQAEETPVLSSAQIAALDALIRYG